MRRIAKCMGIRPSRVLRPSLQSGHTQRAALIFIFMSFSFPGVPARRTVQHNPEMHGYLCPMEHPWTNKREEMKVAGRLNYLPSFFLTACSQKAGYRLESWHYSHWFENHTTSTTNHICKISVLGPASSLFCEQITL